MTTVNLRLKYKFETGKSPTIQKNINYTNDIRKIKYEQWLTDEYNEWLEEEVLRLIKDISLQKIKNKILKLNNKRYNIKDLLDL